MNQKTKPLTYKDEEHPLIEFDRRCKLCSLGKGKAVQGAGPNELENVKLIVISDHPGHYEESNGYPFHANDGETVPQRVNYGRMNGKKEVPNFPNAGKYIRDLLDELYGLDTYNEVWMTNAVKCNPRDKTISPKHVNKCTRYHLLRELTEINKVNPTIPILIAGRYAFDCIKYLDKNLKNRLGTSLKKVRRTNSYRLWTHPLVFTYNPASVRDAEFRKETDIGFTELTKKDKFKVRHIHKIERLPELPGSPRWIFRKDVKYLDDFLVSPSEFS